jgi:hypothetical protein
MPQGSSISPQEAAASGICSALHRAYRDLRFYPPDHPMARQSVDGLISAATSYIDKWGDITLEVQETGLLFEGEAVYSHEASRDNLAFLMFRDGVRELCLRPGIEGPEVEALVGCLAHVDDLAAVEHDLVTAFWEQDFTHIDYRVADPFLGGEVLREGMIDALRETVLHRLEDSPGSVQQSLARDDLRSVEPMQIQSESLQLTQQEMDSGERAVEGVSAVLQDFAEVVLEIVASAPVTAMDDALARSLSAVVAAYLDNGDVEGVSFLVGRLEHMETEGWCPPGYVGAIVGEAVTADHIRRLLQGVGRAQADEIKRHEGFLTSLRQWIFSPLLEILADADDRAVRKSILAVLGAEGGVPWSEIEPFLGDPRWYVVRNAVQLAAAGTHAGLMEHVYRLLGHADGRVRREVLRSLERFGGQMALRGYTKALSDPESSVRTLAARAVGREGGPEQEGPLLAHIEDRNFALLPAEELQAFLGAYAELTQERAVPVLDKLWRKRRLSARPMPVRVAALLALGSVRAPAARSALLEASKSGETQVQRAAGHALQIRASEPSKGRS